MLYRETFANGIIVKYDPSDVMPVNFDQFVSMVFNAMPDKVNIGGPCVGGNEYSYYQLSATVGDERVVGVYNVDYDDFKRFTEGKYVVLPLAREATLDEVEIIEFYEGVA